MEIPGKTTTMGLVLCANMKEIIYIPKKFVYKQSDYRSHISYFKLLFNPSINPGLWSYVMIFVCCKEKFRWLRVKSTLTCGCEDTYFECS